MTSNGLNYAQLAAFGPLSLPILYLTYAHGLRGLVGWVYLFIFCTLRVIGPAITISNQKKGSTSTAGPVISNIGLSPLLLGAIGILHEARRYRNPTKPASHEYIPVLILHLLVGAGVGMLASASSAFDPTSHKAASNLVLLKVGIATLEVVWVVLCAWAVVSLVLTKRRDVPGWRGGSMLLNAVLVALPFIGIRVTFSLVMILTDLKGLVDGKLGLRIALSFIPEVIIVCLFVTVGFVTKNIGKTVKEEVLLEGTPARRREMGSKNVNVV